MTQLAEADDRPAATSRFATVGLEAWTAYERVLVEVGRVTRRDLNELLPYAALRTGIGEDLVVYVGGAERGGFALVAGDGPGPRHVELPLLRAEAVVARASSWSTSGPSTTPRSGAERWTRCWDGWPRPALLGGRRCSPPGAR
jgi:hypothetical protein